MGNIIEKLMIGDFIYVWNPYVVARVEGIDMTTNKIKAHICDKLDEHCEVDANDCSLIPITENVINENMTKVAIEDGINKYREGSAVVWCNFNKKPYVPMCFSESFCLKYVSDLQHLLYHCNYNSDYRRKFTYSEKID